MLSRFENFEQLDIRIGTITDVVQFLEARKPAYKLTIDFGEFGIKKSSAQITELYTPESLIGKQIVAVINFPPKQIGNFISECLVLGVYGSSGVVLLQPEREIINGCKVG
jgi:tRNA-binding protein